MGSTATIKFNPKCHYVTSTSTMHCNPKILRNCILIFCESQGFRRYRLEICWLPPPDRGHHFPFILGMIVFRAWRHQHWNFLHCCAREFSWGAKRCNQLLSLKAVMVRAYTPRRRREGLQPWRKSAARPSLEPHSKLYGSLHRFTSRAEAIPYSYWAQHQKYKYNWYFILLLRARSRLYRRRSLQANTKLFNK